MKYRVVQQHGQLGTFSVIKDGKNPKTLIEGLNYQDAQAYLLRCREDKRRQDRVRRKG